MRISFVLLDAQVTGGQMVALELMRAARSAGHDTLAVFPDRGPMLDRLDAEGLRWRVAKLEHSFRFDQARNLAEILRSERVDVVNAHTLFVGNALASLAARMARVPFVMHVHIGERYSSRAPVAALQRRLALRTARRSAAIVAVSKALRDVVVEAGVASELVTVVHNGVRVRPLGDRPPADGVRLVCIARLAPVKGQTILLEALARAGAGLSVKLVGDDLEHGGAYRAQLERLAVELGIADRVEFLGHRADVPELLDAADALVLPSLDEGLPIVGLEAMERARAVVATAVGGTPELVLHERTGLLVEPSSPDALAGALRRLRNDPEALVRYGEAGRSRVESAFTVEQMADRTLEVLARAASSSRRDTDGRPRARGAR